MNKNSKSDKKITMLIFSLEHGGAEKVCLTLCNEFIHRNYEVELWIINYRETSLTKEINKDVKVIPLFKKHVRNSFFSIIKLLVTRKPKRILIFHIEPAILVILIKRILFLKTIVIVRSINTLSKAFNFPTGIWDKYIAKHAIKYLLNYSSKIIAQSKGMYEDLIKSFNITENKLTIIHNPAINLTANGVQVPNHVNKINEFLYLGRLSPQKGLVNLVNAFKLAHNQYSNIILTIVGSGTEEEMLKEVVHNLDLDSFVNFEGYQENIIPYIERAKATVLTSFFEGFPNVLVESIAIGTPVISFNCPSGPEDIILPRVNGILVENQDIIGFSKVILAIAKDEIHFNKQDIINSANRFSLDKIINKYEQVLSEF